MDYIYANLNDKVTKVTYEGVESSTAIVYVDQDKQTIKVDLKDHLGLTPDNVFSTQVPTINPTDPDPIKEDSFVLLAYVKDGVVTEYKYTSWKQVVEDDIVKRILSLEQSADKLDKLLNGEILVPKAVNSNTADKAKNGLPEPSIDKNIVTNITGEWEAIKAYDIALELPNTITAITDYMFENNDIFSSVIIPSTVTTIGVGAFKNCTRLKEVIIKEGVRVISTSAFEGCDKLENVTIPSTISSIGDNAFWSGNSNKIKVTVNSTIPAELSLSSFNPDTLDYIIVPMGYLDTYKTLWNTYAEFIYDTVPVSLVDIEKLTTILKGTDNILVNHIDGTRNIEISGKDKSNATNLENGTADVLIQTTDTTHSFKVMTDGRAKVQSAPVDNNDVVRKQELDTKFDKINIVQTTGDSDSDIMSQKAVTDEFNALKGDLVDYLDVSHINLDDSTILLDGYIDKNGDVQTHQNWKHTTPILINKNFLAKIKCRTEINIAVISQTDAEGNEYTPIIIGSSPSINTFDYNPNVDTYVSICFPTAYTHELTVIGNYESRITSLERNVDLLNDSTVVEKDVDLLTEATKHTNYFINADTGEITAISSSTRYFYTDNISVKAGDVITVYGKDDSGTVVATLSRWTSNGTFISTLLRGNKTLSTTTYTVPEDMHIRICGQQSTGEDGIKSVTNHTIIIPDAFKKSVNKFIPEPIYLDISMFKTIGVCGDSYTSGAIYVGDTFVGEIAESSWGKVLERMHGIDVTIYAQGGSDTNNYQTRQTCLPKILSDNAKDCYVLALGINDQSSVTLGTIADIHDDYTENPNTFYGNYGRIIAQIKAHAPNAALIISKVFIPTFSSAVYYNYSSAAIEEIASKFSIPFIETADSDFLSSSWYNSNIVHGHPTAPLYSGIAKAMAELIGKSLHKNINYFKNKYNHQNN